MDGDVIRNRARYQAEINAKANTKAKAKAKTKAASRGEVGAAVVQDMIVKGTIVRNNAIAKAEREAKD
eukprot:11416057-Heterocapsa_arctica.AAC.1